MAFDAAFENGPAARSFAADAYDCIMVRIRKDPAEYKVAAQKNAPDGELPSDQWSSRNPIVDSVPSCSLVSRPSLTVAAEERPALTRPARAGVSILRSGRGKACGRARPREMSAEERLCLPSRAAIRERKNARGARGSDRRMPLKEREKEKLN
jgi:hypothetical protein